MLVLMLPFIKLRRAPYPYTVPLILILTRGNVLYKSVGLGLMDLTVGHDLVTLAREKGVGTHIDDF